MAGQPDGIEAPGQGSGMDASATYPRTITFSRVPGLAGTGDQGYRSTAQKGEEPVGGLSDLPCDIQFTTRGPNPLAKVPSDAVGRTLWSILIPSGAAAVGSIKRGDVATDDLDRRFRINEPYWGEIDITVEAELERA